MFVIIIIFFYFILLFIFFHHRTFAEKIQINTRSWSSVWGEGGHFFSLWDLRPRVSRKTTDPPISAGRTWLSTSRAHIACTLDDAWRFHSCFRVGYAFTSELFARLLARVLRVSTAAVEYEVPDECEPRGASAENAIVEQSVPKSRPRSDRTARFGNRQRNGGVKKYKNKKKQHRPAPKSQLKRVNRGSR